MPCQECTRLFALFERLESVKAAATRALRVESLPSDECIKRRIAACNARLDAEVARLQLEQHQRNHAKAT